MSIQSQVTCHSLNRSGTLWISPFHISIATDSATFSRLFMQPFTWMTVSYQRSWYSGSNNLFTQSIWDSPWFVHLCNALGCGSLYWWTYIFFLFKKHFKKILLSVECSLSLILYNIFMSYSFLSYNSSLILPLLYASNFIFFPFLKGEINVLQWSIIGCINYTQDGPHAYE